MEVGPVEVYSPRADGLSTLQLQEGLDVTRCDTLYLRIVQGAVREPGPCLPYHNYHALAGGRPESGRVLVLVAV